MKNWIKAAWNKVGLKYVTIGIAVIVATAAALNSPTGVIIFTGLYVFYWILAYFMRNNP